jgi:hypothetical protein
MTELALDFLNTGMNAVAEGHRLLGTDIGHQEDIEIVQKSKNENDTQSDQQK